MRDLKFRAWDKREKCWIEGAYGFHILGEMMLVGGLFSDWKPERLNDIVLEQFTGLEDKKEVEIYAGDIVEFVWGCICSNCHNVPKWSGGVKFGSLGATVQSYRISDSQNNISETIEVVGNIHENPELLKGKTETIK